MKMVSVIAAAVSACFPLTANALCFYKGQYSVKTTVAQEFNDSKWVVKARLVAATDHRSDDDYSWTLYRIEVLHAYKGHPGKQLQVFTFRDSGGFYMDRPWAPLPAGHDIGSEYLLFLDPIMPFTGLPQAARRATYVNYNCGVSGPWTDVSIDSQEELLSLGAGVR